MGVKLTRHGVGTWSWVCVHLYVMKIIPSLDLVLIKLTSWFLLYLSSLNSIFLKIVISLLMYLAALVLSCCMQTLSYGMGDLIPWLGIEPEPPALGVQSLNHWTASEVPIAVFIWERCHLCFTKFSKQCSTRREYCAFSFKIPLISSVQLELCVRIVFPISTSLPLLKMWEGVDNEETGERGDEQLQQKRLTST